MGLKPESCAVSRIVILQKKALRIRNFHSRDSHSSPLFKSNHILKLEDKRLKVHVPILNTFNKTNQNKKN